MFRFQLLFQESEEFGKTKGLDIMEGKLENLILNQQFQIPYIGWNKIKKENGHQYLKKVQRIN